MSGCCAELALPSHWQSCSEELVLPVIAQGIPLVSPMIAQGKASPALCLDSTAELALGRVVGEREGGGLRARV